MDEWPQILRGSLRTPEQIAAAIRLEQGRDSQGCPRFQDADHAVLCEPDQAQRRSDLPPGRARPGRARADNTGVADPLDRGPRIRPFRASSTAIRTGCLFLVSHSCASYCRFCTRKRKVGDPSKIHPRYIEDGLDYIRNHPEIRDVIVSGGDPLMLSDARLEYILKELRAIPHLEILRVGTRVPCFLPQRVTPELAAMLKKYHPLYVNVHFNHPDELTPEANAGPRSAGRRRHPARLPDRPAQGRQRRPGGHAAADAEAAHGPRPAVLHLSGRLCRRDGPPPDDGGEGDRDHGRAPRLDLGAGRSVLHHRLARRRREDSRPAEIRPDDRREQGRHAQLCGRDLRLSAGAGSAQEEARKERKNGLTSIPVSA